MREVFFVAAFVILLPFGALEDVERSTSADSQTWKGEKQKNKTAAHKHIPMHALIHLRAHLCTQRTQTQCNRPHFAGTKSQTHKMNFYIYSIHIQKQLAGMFTRGQFGPSTF